MWLCLTPSLSSSYLSLKWFFFPLSISPSLFLSLSLSLLLSISVCFSLFVSLFHVMFSACVVDFLQSVLINGTTASMLVAAESNLSRACWSHQVHWEKAPLWCVHLNPIFEQWRHLCQLPFDSFFPWMLLSLSPSSVYWQHLCYARMNPFVLVEELQDEKPWDALEKLRQFLALVHFFFFVAFSWFSFFPPFCMSMILRHNYMLVRTSHRWG